MDKKFEYVIKINGKEVWRGMNPKEHYWEIKKVILVKLFPLLGKLPRMS